MSMLLNFGSGSWYLAARDPAVAAGSVFRPAAGVTAIASSEEAKVMAV